MFVVVSNKCECCLSSGQFGHGPAADLSGNPSSIPVVSNLSDDPSSITVVSNKCECCLSPGQCGHAPAADRAIIGFLDQLH